MVKVTSMWLPQKSMKSPTVVEMDYDLDLFGSLDRSHPCGALRSSSLSEELS